MTPDANDLCVFAVKRGYIESKEIYCNPLYPTYLSLVEKYQHSPYANGILNNHVAVNPKTDCSLLSDSSEVSFVPMANVQEKTNVVSYDMVAYETVKKGFTVFQRGDLIWAKITPCMQNGKSCIVDKMPTEIGFGSTEFHVIRKRNENVYMPFIWAILSSDDVLKAAQATFSGSAGQQRVSASFIENFPAVLPDYPVQVRLVAELEDKLNLLNGKLQRAYELLHKTPMYLIDRLGLTFDFSATQKITYSNVYSEVDTSAAHIFSHYLELGGVFPFHLSSTIFADPECWNVICDDNSVYQFTRKVKALPGGALFKYDNGCSVFLSYNFFSILKESNITQSRLSLDMFRAVTEKFFIEYHQDLSAIPPLANTLVQFCCHSLSNQNPEHYVCCQKAKVSSNKLVVDFEVNSSKIASDIAEAIDRSVEYSVIGELLQPLVCLSKDSYSELFEKMELTSGQKKTLGTTAVRIDYYFNPDTYEIKETDVSELSIRKQIAKICAAAGVLPGTYERRDATEIVRKIQESVVSHLEQAIRTLERDRLHILLLSALATEQLSVNLNRTGATLTEDIEEGERIKSLEKSTQLSEKAKMRKSALLYLIETNLYLVNERKEEAIDSSKLSELLSFAKWIIYLQNSSDLCFHTDSDTKLIVEDDYRIDVELGENYSQTFEKESQRRIIAEPFNLRGDNTDRDFFEKVANAFYEDLGVHFKVLESVLHHLSDSSFSHDNVEFDEIAPNVIKAKATDVLNDYLSFVVENVPVEDVKSAYDFLTIVPGQLKTICDTTHPILPIWEREKRNHCFAVRPIYMSNNDYIYSPIIMEEVRKRWIEGFLQFYPPFEIGLERTCTALYTWKNNYEHLFSSEVEVLLKESGCEYAKHDVDLRREDRRGNHPTIDVLGDYDVIGLNTTQKRIFIIECKVLQPIGSVFEHSNQQKRFFTKEKFDEKFQKRIDYFSKVAMSFFANHGYDTEGFTINPYMVVNKVFSSYYKHVQFPIVTFDELKREIQL